MVKLADLSLFKYPIWIDTSTKKKTHGIKVLRNLLMQLDNMDGAYGLVSSDAGLILCPEYRHPKNLYVRRCIHEQPKESWFNRLGWSKHVNHETYPSVDSFLSILKKQRLIKQDLSDRSFLTVNMKSTLTPRIT